VFVLLGIGMPPLLFVHPSVEDGDRSYDVALTMYDDTVKSDWGGVVFLPDADLRSAVQAVATAEAQLRFLHTFRDRLEPYDRAAFREWAVTMGRLVSTLERAIGAAVRGETYTAPTPPAEVEWFRFVDRTAGTTEPPSAGSHDDPPGPG
jgi:hypothetical protein